MSTAEPSSREKFNAIFSQCMAILKSHGFVPQPLQQIDVGLADVFERAYVGWFGDVMPKPNAPSPPPKKKTGLTQKRMDEITLQCARVFVKEGVKDVHYTQSLNSIRGTVADLLTGMGYENPRGMLRVLGLWGCYKSWEEGARLEGLKENWVSSARRLYQNNYPDLFEAA